MVNRICRFKRSIILGKIANILPNRNYYIPRFQYVSTSSAWTYEEIENTRSSFFIFLISKSRSSNTEQNLAISWPLHSAGSSIEIFHSRSWNHGIHSEKCIVHSLAGVPFYPDGTYWINQPEGNSVSAKYGRNFGCLRFTLDRFSCCFVWRFRFVPRVLETRFEKFVLMKPFGSRCKK